MRSWLGTALAATTCGTAARSPPVATGRRDASGIVDVLAGQVGPRGRTARRLSRIGVPVE